MLTYLRKLIFLHKKKGFTLLSLLLFALTGTATLAFTLNDSKSQKIDDRQQLQYSQIQEHTSNFFGSVNETFSAPNFLYAEPLFKPNNASDSYEQTISNFFQAYPDLFQTTIDDFRVEIEKPKARNITQVHLFQKYKNVPVFGGEVIFTFNDNNELISYLGKYVPRVSIDVNPKTTSKEIKDIVASDLKIDSVTAEPRLFVFNKGVLTDTKESTQLVWRLGTNSWVYFLNANTKEVVYKYEDVNSALNREVYSAGGGTPTLPGTLEISEGDDISTLPDGDDAKNAYNYSEDVYNYFYNHFGLDSYDGAGSPMVSTVDYDTSNLARWCNYLKPQDVDDCPDFQGVLFYADYTVLDITAHEWAHAVNDYAVRDEATESYGLTMLEQSGAMNESYSDIFGVLIEEEYGDGLDWDIGDDSPHGIFRNLADPTLYSQPDDWVGYNSSEDSHYNSGIPNKAAYLIMREASDGYETFNSVDVRGMGTDMAEEIFYYALRDELTVTSTFEDNLNALLQTCFTLETIDIDTKDCESIYDAYTAIGVADGTIIFVEANLTSDTTSGYGPLTVNFDGSDSVSFGRNITDYTWDFGDGTTASTSTTATASHTYDPGSYTATLTITDSDGQTDSETVSIEVTNPIDATFSQTGDGVAAPATVSFDASATTDQTGTITDYAWNFGDSSTTNGTSATASHSYVSSGNYNVTLTVTDNVGYTDTSSHMVYIGATGPATITGTVYNDTWTAARSPYVINGSVTVASGYTLTIEPGVVVKFASTTSNLTVNGTLNAEGTSSDQIVFTSYKDDTNGGDTNGDGSTTSPAAGDWRRIYFASGSDVTLDYVAIQYGGYEGSGTDYPMISSAATTFTLTNSTVNSSDYYAIQVTSGTGELSQNNITEVSGTRAIDVTGGAVIADSNTITGTTGYGIYISSASSSVTNNTITSGNTGIYVTGSTSAPTISNNTISSYSSSGISLSAGSSSVTSNTISDDDDFGIYVSGGTPTISTNIFSSSTASYVIYVYAGTPSIDANTISGGVYGIYLYSSTFAVTNNTITGTTYPIRLGVLNSINILTGNTGSDNSYNAIFLSGSTASDYTLTADNDLPYVINTQLTVSIGTTLTIEPGMVIKMDLSRDVLTVNGTLNAVGTESEPIIFTSIKDDAYGGDTNNDGSTTVPAASDWTAISFASGSIGNLEYTNIRYGGNYYNCMVYMYEANVTIQNSSLTNSSRNIIAITDTDAVISNNVISGAPSSYDGVYISSGSPVIESNIITNNYIGIYSNSTANPLISGNMIADNSYYGVYNRATSVTINAENNWWGDASGPYNSTSNPTAVGDDVSSYVDFDPWLTADPTIADTTPPADVELSTTSKDVWTPSIVLNWTNPTDADFDHIQIDRTDVASGISTTLSSAEVGTSYTDSTPSYATTYTYTLYAVDSTGNVSTGVTTASQRLQNPKPGQRALTSGDTTLTVNWNTSSAPSSTIAGYKVYYGTTPDALTNVVDVGNVITTTLTGLTNFTRYYVAVSVYNRRGMESDLSNSKAGRPHP